jgi:Helicase conserved C-terminal domain
MNSTEVREQILDSLILDLVGPVATLKAGNYLQQEILPGSTAPLRWYLAGFLAPFAAKPEEKTDEDSGEQIDLIPPKTGLDDEAAPESASSRKTPFPSSMGLSVLIPQECRSIKATVTWGDYEAVLKDEAVTAWQRTSRSSQAKLPIPEEDSTRGAVRLKDSGGLDLVLSVRTIPPHNGLDLVAPGTRAVSVFLVNNRNPILGVCRDEAYVFQVTLQLESEVPFVARPDLRGVISSDPDERVADLQYRDAFEYAVGHGVSARALPVKDGGCRSVETAWIPRAEVERIEHRPPPANATLDMEKLANIKDAAEAKSLIEPLIQAYREWITKQPVPVGSSSVEKRRADVATKMLSRAGVVAGRVEQGLKELADPEVLEAFRLANRVMAAVGRQRRKDITEPPKWRPFQLAFLLLNLTSMAEPENADRELVDLLFFPTGGGKTEAYLGLAAFTMFLRRLRNPGSLRGCGVTVIMRYTLRLLTLDQLGRGAAMICAMELERTKDVKKLGTWPFEIGLWVGQAATPNRMGKSGERDENTARARTRKFKQDQKTSPIPLEVCPWCGTKFSANSFNLVPIEKEPLDLRITCVNRDCEFSGGTPLPIVAVDEPIYRRLPAFLIATVDKFASLPWEGQTGKLFGKVDRADSNPQNGGFYGPCDPNSAGEPLPEPLLPPDLIIQDELHLISGPLGTMVGLYETAIDALCSREITKPDGQKKIIRPKVVASTATVRRAESQIKALFCRNGVEIFPCPGPDRRDSYFAITVSVKEKPGRLYAGIAAQGRSPKVIFLRTYLALLGAAQKAFLANGGLNNLRNPADPYMTLTGYFNSLRELGGCRRIAEDEVTSRLKDYGNRLRVGETTGLFAKRDLREVVELTSRISTSAVSKAKDRLAKAFLPKADCLDIALATNMISVGLDISRLGLMAVFGQPKTTAEYIQATSRVGREEGKPGLIITMLNVHKPRDRSHYERFEAWHASFYRSVEATSVTPFSPRALDRGLAEVTVALSRQGWPGMTKGPNALRAMELRSTLSPVVDIFGRRVEQYAALNSKETQQRRDGVRGKVEDLLDDWAKISKQQKDSGASLRYQQYDDGTGPYLLRYPLDPDLERLESKAAQFKAHRSLRDVEPACNLRLIELNGNAIEPEEDLD